jgi:hypothetical protein
MTKTMPGRGRELPPIPDEGAAPPPPPRSRPVAFARAKSYKSPAEDSEAIYGLGGGRQGARRVHLGRLYVESEMQVRSMHITVATW